MYRLIDTHAHLDEVEDLEVAIEQARKAGVIAVVAVGSDYRSNEMIMDISQRYRPFVYPALGMHPGNLAGLEPSEIDDNLRFLEQNIDAVVAVGEIGLDYDKRIRKGVSKGLQQAVLRSILAIARDHSKPVIIHSRYAWDDAFRLAHNEGIEKAVFHWFTGPSGTLRDIVAAGYFVSATPAVEYHAEHRRAMCEVPLDNLLLETDSPVTYGREIRYEARPADVLRSLDAVAQLKGMANAMVADQTTKHAIDFFALDIVF